MKRKGSNVVSHGKASVEFAVGEHERAELLRLENATEMTEASFSIYLYCKVRL